MFKQQTAVLANKPKKKNKQGLIWKSQNKGFCGLGAWRSGGIAVIVMMAKRGENHPVCKRDVAPCVPARCMCCASLRYMARGVGEMTQHVPGG